MVEPERRSRLVLSRKIKEQVMIGKDIIVTVVHIQGDKVRLSFEAPKNVQIDRMEVSEKKMERGG